MSASSIATKRGDDGSTSLLYGQRVPKSHPQIAAVGTLDELNVALGSAKVHLPAQPPVTRELIESIQKNLVALMGEIACAETDLARYKTSQFEQLTDSDLDTIEAAVAALENKGLRFEGWATPGTNPLALAFDTARVTARRAERQLVSLPSIGRHPRPLLGSYLNRLSDLLWLLAREAESGN